MASDSKYDDMSVISLDDMNNDGLMTPLPGSKTASFGEDMGPRVFGVKVVLRPRPAQEEGRRIPPSQFALTFVDDAQVQLTHADKTHKFTYDHVFSPGASQDDVYELAARSTINDVLKGYNGTIFAYGQTGSGKTHTMFGPGAVGMAADGASGADLRGIIPRAVREIYERTAEMAHECQFTIRVSFLEVYQERIYDLLIPASPALPIRENKDRGIHVPGLTEEFCPTEKDVGTLIARGERLRSVAITLMNDRSSRSHSVLVLTLEQRNLRDGSSCVGRLNLVDLAGSERIYRSGVTGAQFEEATVINLSLTTLGRVVNALTTGARGTNHIPYRDSTLTRFLQDSLGGNTKTTLVVTIAVDASSGDETLSSLRFGQRAKFIKNRATVNVKKTSEELEKMIVSLRAQLSAAHATIQQQAARIKELESRQNGVAPSSLSAVTSLMSGGRAGGASSVSPTSMLVDDESPSHSPQLSPVSPMRTGGVNKATRDKGRSPYSSDPRPMEGGYCRYQFVADPMHKISLRASVASTQAIDSLLCYDRWSTEHFLQSYSLAGPLALLPLLSPSPMVIGNSGDGSDQPSTLTADNWNERFQSALELGEEDESRCMHKYALLEQLSIDFLAAARTYGKLIISEQFLTEEQRTIRALANGGVAGGQRFLVRGIIFKLAQDPLMMAFGTPPFFLYGGRRGSSLEFAAKAAAHDLKAASNYFELTLRRGSQKKLGRGDGLRIPLQATIDYRGFRLTAMPWLPLKGTAGLVYGSADGGATVHDDDPNTTAYMEYASNELHIAPHYVGDALLYAAGDMEAHRGTDGRIYVLDLARAFPPECPYAAPVPSSSSLSGDMNTLPEQPSIFYRFLRREYLHLLKQCGYPALSPDCYSGWSEGARDAGIQHHRLTLATEALTKTVIPAIATYLDGPDPSRDEKSRVTIPGSGHGDDDQLTFALSLLPSMLHLPVTGSADDMLSPPSAALPSFPTPAAAANGAPTPLPISALLQFPASPQLHAWGVNMRHMGLLRSLLRRNQRARDILLIEMVARTLKNTLRGWLRGMGSANSRESSSMPSSLAGAASGSDNGSSSGRDASDGPVRKTIVLFFNLVTASLDKRYCDHFWQHTVLPGLYQRFGPFALDGDDLTKTDLLTLVSSHLRTIIDHTLTMMGMQLTTGCSVEFANYRSPASLADEDWRGFLFTPMDIEDHAQPKTKHLGLLEYAQGRLLCGLARSARLAKAAGLRLLPMAAQRFRSLSHPSARIEWTLARAMHAEWQTNPQLADYTLTHLLDDLFTPPTDHTNNGHSSTAIVRASSPASDTGIYFPESCLPVISALLDMWEGRLRDCASALANSIFTRIKTHAHFGGASSYYALRRLRECTEVWVKTDPDSTVLRGDEKDEDKSSSSSAAHVRTTSTSSINGMRVTTPASQLAIKRVQALEKLRDSVLTRTARLLLQCFGSTTNSDLPPTPSPLPKSQPLALMVPLVAPSTSIASFLSLMNSATPPPPAPPPSRPAASPWHESISTRESKQLASGEATALNEEWRRLLRKLAIRLPPAITEEMKHRATPSAQANGTPPFFLPRYVLFKLLPLLDTEVACLLAQELGIDMDWRLEDNSTGNGGSQGGIDGLEARERCVGRAGSYIVLAGKTPLMCAAEAGWPAAVAALLAAGADPTAHDSAKRTPLAWADIGRASEEATGEDEAEIDGAPKVTPPPLAAAGRPGSSQGSRASATSATDSKIAVALRREEAAKRKRSRAADRDQVVTLLMEARKQQSSARQAAELSDLLRMVNERKQLLRLIQEKKANVERAVEDARPNDRVVVKQQRDEWLRRERDELEGRAELQKMLLHANEIEGKEAYDEAHGSGIERDVKRLKMGVDIAASLESQLRVTTTLLEETRQRLDEAKRERVVLDEREQGLRALLNKKKLPTEPPSPGGSSSGSFSSSSSAAERGAVGRRASASSVDLVPTNNGLRRSATQSQTMNKGKYPITTYRLPPPAKSPPANNSNGGSASPSSIGGTSTIATPTRYSNGVPPMTPPLTPSLSSMAVPPNLNRLSSINASSISPSSSQPSTPRRLSTASTSSVSSSVTQWQTVIALRVGPAPPDRPEAASLDLYHTPNANKLLPVWETIGGSALQSVLPPPYRASWAFDRSYWSADGFTLTPSGRAISSAAPGAPPATFCMQPFATNAMVCKDIGMPMTERLWHAHNVCLVAYAANEEDAQTEKERSVLGTAGDPGLLPEMLATLLERSAASECLISMELTVAEVGMVPMTEADGSISWSKTSQITDLLDMESDKEVLLPIDLTAVTVDSYEAVHRVITSAMARRHRAPDTSQPCGHVISRLQFTWTRNPEAKSSASSSSGSSPLPMPSLPTATDAGIGNMERRARFAMVDLRPRETASTTMPTQSSGVSGSTDGVPVWQARLNRSADVIASVLAGNASSIDHPLMTLLDDVCRTDGSYRVMLGAIGPYAVGRPGIAWDPVHTLNYLAAIKSGAALMLPSDGASAAVAAAKRSTGGSSSSSSTPGGTSRTGIQLGAAPKRSSITGRLAPSGSSSSLTSGRTSSSGLAAPKSGSNSGGSAASGNAGLSATGTRARRVLSSASSSSVGASPTTPQRIVTSSVKKT